MEHIFQQLHGLCGQLVRRCLVQCPRHSVHLAEAVPAAQDLPPKGALVLHGVLIELPHEPQPLFQQTALLLGEADIFGAAQLHIAADRPHHKVDEEGQPIGRLVEEQQRRSPLLPVADRQRRRRQKCRSHPGIQPVDIGRQHDEGQPEVHHPELRL